MIDLAVATKARFEADTTLTALGKLWLDQEAATDSSNVPLVPPFARQSYIASSNDEAFGLRYIENTQLQFTIYANAATTIKTYYDALIASFDRSSFTLTGGTLIAAQRIGQYCGIEPAGVDKSGNPVYQCWARYRFKIDRTF